MRRALRQAGECACDDCVVSAGGAGPDYAAHLLEAAADSGGRYGFVSPGVVPGGNFFLEERIMSLLSNHKRTLAPALWLRGLLTTLMLALVLTLGLLTVNTSAGDDPAPKPAPAAIDDKDLPGINDFVAVETVAEMIHYETPEYPKEAAKANLEGAVWVRSLVQKDGTVAKSALGKTSGYDILDSAALKAASKCRFKPATKDGKPVAMWIMYKISFSLDGSDTAK
jgi:TonB family protein